MKFFSTLLTGLLLLGSTLAARAQAPTWQSAYLAGGNAYSQVTATATDAGGNVYLAGYFSNATIVLGSITLTNAVTSGSQVGFSQDAFVAKWSAATRTFVWARRAGGPTGQDKANAIAVSGSSVYVGATINGPGFEGTTVATTDCVTKLTDAGTVVWVQGSSCTVAALAASGSSVYVAGTFQNSISVGSTPLSSAGSLDVAVARLTDLGTSASWAWAQRAGGPGLDAVSALAIDGPRLYLAATYSSTATFGTTQLPADGSCVAQLTDAGTSAGFGWAQAVPGATFKALAAGGGRLYATGSFGGTALFGSAILTSLGTASPFIVRLADAGTSASFAWAQQVSDASATTNVQTVVASGNNVYVAGALGNSASFGGSIVTNTSGATLFIAKLLDGGSQANFAWVMPASAGFSVFNNTLALSGANIYLAGMLAGPLVFADFNLPPSGGPVAYLAVLVDNAALAAAAPAALAGLALAPNPAHGSTLVRVPAGAGPAAATLTLLDALGRVVRTAQAAAGQDYPLDLKGLAPGVYTLRVRAGGLAAARKLVVE